MKQPSLQSIIRGAVHVDSASTRAGVVTLRKGYYYTQGKTAQDFADRIVSIMESIGHPVSVVSIGDQWAPFRGGASVGQSSHWWVKVKAA